MVKSGIGGAEELADIMNRIISRMTECAWTQGGELVNWEGDAGTFVWFVRDNLALDDATVLAVQTAFAFHREAESWLVDGAPIRFRSAVGCGSLSHIEIGGKDDEWHSVLTGEAMLGVIAAEKVANPGEIVLSRSATARASGRFHCVSLEDGTARVLSVARHARPPETPPPSGEVPLNVLRKAVPQILLADGRKTSASPGEFRVITACYIRLRHPNYALPEDTLATLQDAAQRVQSCLARFEGQIYEIVGEEEGITFIAAFGLPPWSHEDGAARAVKSALTLHREWGALGLTSSTGIATGRIFCGIFRTKTDRAVPAFVGPIMNLAARLMQLNAGVVCDEETRQSGRQSGRILARQLTPRTVKGKPDPITAFAAYDVASWTWPARSAEESTVIGREQELSVLLNALAKARAGAGSVVIVEGDAGIGKTTLINRAAAKARELGMIVLAGDGDSTDQTTAYLAWRRIFLDLLDQSDLTLRVAAARSSPGSHTEILRARPGKQTIRLGRFAHLAPLLEDVLGLEAVDNTETALLSGQARAQSLVRLLEDLLLEAAKTTPVLVVMEDMHWLDPTSLNFFAALGELRGPLMLLGATRGPDASPVVRKSLTQVNDILWLRLEPMNTAETGWLLARTLGARQADDGLAAMFRDRTGGNPLFVEELSRMAFANRLLFIDGVVQARSSVAAAKSELDDILERQGLPSTIEGVIRRRLDGLTHQDLLVLRAASVVGQSFDRTLCSVGAPMLAAAEVDRSLAVLIGLGVIEPSDRSADEFVFRHAVLRDAVYNAMSFAERRQLHDTIGSWIEERPHTEDVSALLGRHFLHAQRIDKAIHYLVAAGEIAFRRYANEEAAEILLRARELDLGRADVGSDRGAKQAEKAHLSLLLGRAFLGLSRYEDCRAHSETGLSLAGFPAPASSLGVALGILKQTITLVRYRVRPLPRPVAPSEKALLRESILAFEALAETYFYSGDGLRTLNAAMNTLNLSERLGPSAELARGCSTLSGVAGLFRLQGVSRHYSTRALDILAKLEDPAAETWVFNLLGLSQLGEGHWEESREFFAKVVSAAERIGERRRWRDGVENAAVIEACRGRWTEALGGLTAMLEAAKQVKDQRYTVLASRERAYCQLQLGDLHAVEEDMRLVREELDRGLAAEQLPTRVDLHVITASLALERRDYVLAASEAGAAMDAIVRMGATSSVANAYWPIFLVSRVFANTWLNSARQGAADRSLLKGMAAACRALSNQSWSYPIAAPPAAIARGYLASLKGRPATAKRLWRRAAATATRLDMNYEAQLAQQALGEVGARHRGDSGLPFLIDDGSANAR
jgi:hypothetical protein